jgi:hypothetical protein
MPSMTGCSGTKMVTKLLFVLPAAEQLTLTVPVCPNLVQLPYIIGYTALEAEANVLM